jgi:hypothetical protein
MPHCPGRLAEAAGKDNRWCRIALDCVQGGTSPAAQYRRAPKIAGLHPVVLLACSNLSIAIFPMNSPI